MKSFFLYLHYLDFKVVENVLINVVHGESRLRAPSDVADESKICRQSNVGLGQLAALMIL